MENNVKKLYRNSQDKKIAGVCSGLAEYFNVDTTVVRILFLTALVVFSFGFWLYIIIWLLTPEK